MDEAALLLRKIAQVLENTQQLLVGQLRRRRERREVKSDRVRARHTRALGAARLAGESELLRVFLEERAQAVPAHRAPPHENSAFEGTKGRRVGRGAMRPALPGPGERARAHSE